MTTNQYVSVRETAQLLGVTEKKVMDLIDQRKLQAYRIADRFLRLKKSEVMDLRNAGEVPKENIQFAYTKAERLRDFLYFNDFYLITFSLMLVLLYIILYTS